MRRWEYVSERQAPVHCPLTPNQGRAIACCGGFPCPTCGQWSDVGYCYSCGTGGSSTAPTPAAAKPDIPVSVGVFDAHSNTWVPAHGKETELGALLGGEWVFDSYYGKFFSGESAG